MNVKRNIALENIPAVILAAGEGSRLSNGKESQLKPLTLLNGQSLLEHCLLACVKAGVTRFFLVSGFLREKLETHAMALAETHGLNLQVIENRNWEQGNGTSAAACAPFVEGPFFIMMCDHLLDPGILTKLVASDFGDDVCSLAVDKKIDQVFDIDDATCVDVDGEKILKIGKDLQTYNGIDTGFFLCRPVLFNALEKSRKAGDASLSGGIRELCRTGNMKAVDIGDSFWLDVDTPESLEEGKRILPKF